MDLTARFRSAGVWLVACLVLLGATTIPVSMQAASITYLPDTSTAEILGTQRNLSALTWQLPRGLLIVDRLTPEPGQATRYGQGIQPRQRQSEWFLVNTNHGNHGAESGPELLATLGTIHVQDWPFFLVEVAPVDLEAFTQLPYDKSRLPMTPPPAGWDHYGHSGQIGLLLEKATRTDVQDFVNLIDPAAYNLILQEISGAISFWHEDTEHLVSTRYYNTSDKELVASYLASRLESYGYEVMFEEFYYNSNLCRNIVATKLGTTLPNEVVVLGGHYDSTSPVHTLAPGAEDNGSGTALVMEVARIAAERNFDRSLQFVLFDSEEQGLNGSYHFVDTAVNLGRDIIAAVIADMVSWYSTHYAVIIEGDEPYEWLMGTMEDNVAAYTPLGSRKEYFSWGSDHVPFQQASIASFLAIDWDWNNYPHYHQTTDTWNNVADTAEIAAQIAKACAATLADVAGLQPVASPVSEQIPQVKPQLAAFPNPFNPQVTISLSLPAGVSTRLSVYDLAGQRLAILHDGFLPAGRHAVVWDGRDRQGRTLGSGTYLCRLETPALSTSLKLNLAR